MAALNWAILHWPVVSPVAYGLDLLPAQQIHLVFDTSNLKRFKHSEEFEGADEPPPSIIVKGEEYCHTP